jgi:RNA polymerase sigma-70 factor, ECF subfamily
MDPLVERARTGDPAALEALLTQLAPSVQRFGMRMCRNAADADDMLQDTLLLVADHLGEFEGRSSLTSWVFTLARTACARRRRGLKNRPAEGAELLAGMPDASLSPEAQAEQRQLSQLVVGALDSLSDEHREVIALRDIEGLPAKEAAEVLGLSVDALKSRLHRAREALREVLRPALEAGAPPPTAQCPDIADRFSRHLEGDLSSMDCATMEQHVASCAHCGRACDALKQALSVCKDEAAQDISPTTRARIKAALGALAAARAKG